jgi:hypothetical protein
VIVQRGMGDMGGEVADAFKSLTGQVGAKVVGNFGKVEFALQLAAYASVAAALLAGWAAWNTRKG